MSELVKLDRIDLKILARVQDNGRITNNHLAEQVGLSPSPCLQRLRRLEQQGVIGRYLGVIELARVCRHVTVIATVTLRNHGAEDFDSFEAIVRATPQVVECIKVSGTVDYILRFVCPDLESYHALSDQLLKAGRESPSSAATSCWPGPRPSTATRSTTCSEGTPGIALPVSPANRCR